MKRLILYIHGKGGTPDEAEHYRPLFPGCDVVGLDYRAQTPWDAEEEFPRLFRERRAGYSSVLLIANSIGAYFAMRALSHEEITGALLISPVVDMERLIADMMAGVGVTEERLRREKTIATSFGETLSWEYLSYVRGHPLDWHKPTYILYGERDNLVAKDTILTFAGNIGASLTVAQGAEHWFHTDEQMKLLDDWVRHSAENLP